MSARRLLVTLPALAVVLAALVGPLLAPHSVAAGVGLPFATADGDAWLGTDRLGRDVLSQLLGGGWGLILLAVVIAALVTTLSAVLGAVAALRPRAGAVIERCADLAMLLPPLLAILLVLLSWPESGVLGIVVVAVGFGTPYCARVFAAAAAPVAASGYVEAAQASGESLWHLVFREVLPNLREVALTQLGLRFVAGMYVVATASFLALPAGLGATNWAVMVRDNASGVLLNPWAVLAPAFAIGTVAVCVNLLVSSLSPAARTLGDRA